MWKIIHMGNSPGGKFSMCELVKFSMWVSINPCGFWRDPCVFPMWVPMLVFLMSTWVFLHVSTLFILLKIHNFARWTFRALSKNAIRFCVVRFDLLISNVWGIVRRLKRAGKTSNVGIFCFHVEIFETMWKILHPCGHFRNPCGFYKNHMDFTKFHVGHHVDLQNIHVESRRIHMCFSGPMWNQVTPHGFRWNPRGVCRNPHGFHRNPHGFLKIHVEIILEFSAGPCNRRM